MSNLELQNEFAKIYDQTVEKIYRFVFIKVNSQEVAEDLTSETFARGWAAFQKINPGIRHPSGFFYKIARNLVIDFYRQRGRAQIVTLENATLIQDTNRAISQAEISADLVTVRKALVKLNDDYQDLIIWHYLNDLAVPEIALMMEKSEEAVRTQLSRALDALRQEVGLALGGRSSQGDKGAPPSHGQV